MTFQLPPDISFQKERLAYGWAYVFRHAELGTLGRIVLQDRPDGKAHLTCELVGDQRDPMTEKRAAIFKPLAKRLVQQMNRALGQHERWEDAQWVNPPPRPPEPRHKIASTLMQCMTCRANVALLIYADEAEDQGGLEDYARLMYATIAELDVQTWVIGPPSGTGPPMRQTSDILKVWPQQEPLFQSCPDDFNPLIEKLITTHCQ